MSAFPWGALIGAAGNIAGGLLGGKDNSAKKAAKAAWKNQEKTWLRGPQLMVEGAQRAGLHPLAVLGANWSAPGAAVVSGQSTWGDAVGSGLEAAGNAYDQYQARKEAEAEAKQREHLDMLLLSSREARESRLADAQVKALEAEAFRNRTEGFMRSAQTRTEIANGRSAAIGGAGPVVKLPLSGEWELAPGSSTAQEAQDVLGEPFEWLASAENALWNLFGGTLFGSAPRYKQRSPRYREAIKAPMGRRKGQYVWHR